MVLQYFGNIIKMVSGTDEPLSVGSDEPHFSMQFDINLDGYTIYLGNSVVTDVQFGHLFLVCIKYVALQEVTCGLFRKISHCSYYI